jgi:glutaredoxin
LTAKEFLSSRGIPFEEKDIRSDPEALRELVEDLNSRSTPTLVINGKVVVGFDPAEYECILGPLER